MIVKPHCDRPVLSFGIGSFGAQGIPAMRPHRTWPHWEISITPPPGAHHSSIADVYLPPSADRDPDSSSESERWDIPVGYAQAVAQQEALLPVGKPLDGYPWCQKTKMPPSEPGDEVNWIWGRPRDAIIVSVFPGGDNASSIVVRRTTEASLYCS